MVFLHYLIEHSINMFIYPLIVLAHAKSVDCVACCICHCSVKFIEVMKLMYFLNLCRQSHLDVVGVLSRDFLLP